MLFGGPRLELRPALTEVYFRGGGQGCAIMWWWRRKEFKPCTPLLGVTVSIDLTAEFKPLFTIS